MLNVKHMFSVSLELPHAPVALVLKHLPVLPVFNTRNSITNQRFFFPLVYRTDPVSLRKLPDTVSAGVLCPSSFPFPFSC